MASMAGHISKMEEAVPVAIILVVISTMEAEVDVFLHISKINNSKTLISIPFFLTEDSHFQMGVHATITMHPSPSIMVKVGGHILEVIN